MKYEMQIGMVQNGKKAEKTVTFSVEAADYSSAWEIAVDRITDEFSKTGAEFISIENFKRVA